MSTPHDRFPTASPTASFSGQSQHRFPLPLPTGSGSGATTSPDRFPHPMKGTPMTEPQEDRDDTSRPGRFHNGDRFEIAGDTMTRTDGRWSCSCGQIHDDEQVQVDLTDGLGVLVMAVDDAANVPAVEGAREARYVEAIDVAACQSMRECSWVHGHSRELAHAVLPLVDAEVAAAVSEAQAEARGKVDRARQSARRAGLLSDTAGEPVCIHCGTTAPVSSGEAEGVAAWGSPDDRWDGPVRDDGGPCGCVNANHLGRNDRGVRLCPPARPGPVVTPSDEDGA